MARVDRTEIERHKAEIEQALNGMVYGTVTIEVHAGEIRNVYSDRRKATLRNGRPVGEEPRASNE